MNDTGVDTRQRRIKLHPFVPAFLLMASWFVPDIWSEPPRFPFHLVQTLSGQALVPHFVWPAAGALMLVIHFLPISSRKREGLIMVMGLFGVLIPFVFGHPGLMTMRLMGLIFSLVSIVGTVLVFRRFNTPYSAHSILAAPPLAFLVLAIIGVITGEHSAAYLWSFKAPCCLYLSMLVTSRAAVRFF